MLTQDILVFEPNYFWQILPHERRLLQKKRGVSWLAYLLLYKWFDKNASFPMDVKTISSNLIEYGINLSEELVLQEDLFIFFEQERTINRYKQEIREFFKLTIFNEGCPLLHEFLMTNVFKEKNEEALQIHLCEYLKKAKIETQYVDSHGQSELGFALSYLEKFDLHINPYGSFEVGLTKRLMIKQISTGAIA